MQTGKIKLAIGNQSGPSSRLTTIAIEVVDIAPHVECHSAPTGFVSYEHDILSVVGNRWELLHNRPAPIAFTNCHFFQCHIHGDYIRAFGDGYARLAFVYERHYAAFYEQIVSSTTPAVSVEIRPFAFSCRECKIGSLFRKSQFSAEDIRTHHLQLYRCSRIPTATLNIAGDVEVFVFARDDGLIFVLQTGPAAQRKDVAFAHFRIQRTQVAAAKHFIALLHVEETESVSKRLAPYEIFGEEVNTEFNIRFLMLNKHVVCADFVIAEIAYYIYLVRR